MAVNSAAQPTHATLRDTIGDWPQAPRFETVSSESSEVAPAP